MKQILIYLMMMLIMLILVILLIMMSVAFLTLMERKILGLVQFRKGPNKVGLIGIIQPFSDAIKLVSKESIFMIKSNYLYYLISPMFMFMLILMMWLIFPVLGGGMLFNLGLIYLMCCFSLGGYGLLVSGWASNSVYSMYGSIRSLSQAISYEVSLSMIMLILMLNYESFNLKLLNSYSGIFLLLYMYMMGVMFLFSLMAELNRTPFDFSEGESELVSGFNVEYMSSGFILIFLSEYLSILFLSYLYVELFIMKNDGFMFFMIYMMVIYLIIWLRGTMPRFRYDLLMYLCWLVILPFILNFMMLVVFMKLLI